MLCDRDNRANSIGTEQASKVNNEIRWPSSGKDGRHPAQRVKHNKRSNDDRKPHQPDYPRAFHNSNRYKQLNLRPCNHHIALMVQWYVAPFSTNTLGAGFGKTPVVVERCDSGATTVPIDGARACVFEKPEPHVTSWSEG